MYKNIESYFNSLILSSGEDTSIYRMTNKSAKTLLYRATRDGFTPAAFHSRCDNISNTITIIKTNLNYVFGGYTSVGWNSNEEWITDSDAYIFSLRRNGISTNEKYVVKSPQYAYIGFSSSNLFAFGAGYDVLISANSNKNNGSFTNFGFSYQLPLGYTYPSQKAQNYLSGNYNNWFTTEIEVFQLEFFDSLILTANEDTSLYLMNNKLVKTLLYRATRDGFTPAAFHSRCDNKPNAITIIKNNLNHVFGGYTSVGWDSNGEWITDNDAYIFSLRRNGTSTNEKYVVLKPENAFFGFSSSNLFAFGAGYDICVIANSNTNSGSTTNFGFSYQLPLGYTYPTQKAQNYLSGNFNNWLTTEIEVFQLEFFDSLILTATEDTSLYLMNNKLVKTLLYRATRDGFTNAAFHSRCDNKPNTVTIIKNNLNYVFGGYTPSGWNSNQAWITDEHAFIFSLRRNGTSTNEKYGYYNYYYQDAYYISSTSNLFVFGGGFDIFISANSNIETGSYTNFGYTFYSGYGFETPGAQSYLSGSYNKFLTTEIEVFQLE